MSKDCPALAKWLQKRGSYTSHDIQNEIISLIYHSVMRSILSKISASRFFSLIIDGGSDAGFVEQIYIRYLEDLKPKEEFLGFYATESKISACRGQSYDGAANMSGDIKGLQGRISLLEPRAIFVHCYAHNLNLILKDATADHPLFRDLFSCVHTLSNMVRESPKRMANFKNLAKLNEEPGIVLKPFCATRWTVRVLSLDAVAEQIESYLA